MEHYSTIKKTKIMPFAATWMQLEIFILNEISHKGKDKYPMISLTYVEFKRWHKGTYRQNIKRFMDTENRLVVAKGVEEGGGGMGSLESVGANYYM